MTMSRVLVDFPSLGPGEWSEWGMFDTTEEAVAALRNSGVPVDDDGKLLLVSNMIDHEACEGYPGGCENCWDHFCTASH